MSTITAVHGDITTIAVDAVVNAANMAMRGGGGVDGAIHRAGGPTILRDCIARFPDGLAIGDAGWTTAGDLPAKWVIHTVGPNYAAGQQDRALLQSCYRRALEVAAELDVRTIAFPLISAGAYGWPRRDAIAVAVETIASARSGAQVQLVAVDQAAYEEIEAEFARWTPMRILQAVLVLHRRGYQGSRILPGMSASGMYWRVTVTGRDDVGDASAHPSPVQLEPVIRYTTGDGTDFADTTVTLTTSPDEVADAILAAQPTFSATYRDPAYARWYEDLMELVERHCALPVAYADYFDAGPGWEVGWGSGIRHPHPPGRAA